MPTLSRITFLTGLVGVLVVLNLVTVGLLWRPRPAGPSPGDGPAQLLVKKLAFSPPQERAFAGLRQEHQRQMQELRPQMMHLKTALFAQLAQPATPAAVRSAALARIAANQRRIDSVTVAHFAAVRALLTPTQQAQFDDLAPDLPRLLLPGRPAGQGRRRPPQP